MSTQKFDIVIVGGGVVGCTLALALSQMTSLSVAILEANAAATVWDEKIYHPRVSAITLTSQKIFKQLGVWQKITASRFNPFRQISIWDEVTQADLHFTAEEIATSALGYIIENNLLQDVLLTAAKKSTQIHFLNNVKLIACDQQLDSILLTDQEQNIYQAKLAIAADGANSWLRAQSNIAITKKDYEEAAIVAHVRTEYPHDNIARQVFTSQGPLAFLPLAEANLSSIVWTLSATLAEQYQQLSIENFSTILATTFAERLGKITEVQTRYRFPLFSQATKNYIAHRIVLMGDAAHTVHPLAGQGINMGILDAAVLAEIITQAVTANRDYSQQIILRKYERWRRADNAGLLFGIDWLHDTFAKATGLVPNLRALGLQATAKLPWLKKIFMQHAVGARARLPRLANKTLMDAES